LSEPFALGTVRRVNPAVQGKIYPPITILVGPERVAAFRAIFGLSEGVPPTFATVAEFEAFPTVMNDPELGLDFSRVLHADQAYEYARPLREGETLTATCRIDSIRVKGINGFLTVVTELVGDDGAVACTARATMIERLG
jgi:N-terminal half of MaoC dehydratase